MPENSHLKDGDNFVIMAIIILTVFIVAVVTYSAYLFVDLTHVPNIVGIHVTKSLKMAASDAQGKLYSDEKKGIKDWIVYTDRSNGFEIKYPNDLVLQKGEGDGQHMITIKKANQDFADGISSLSSVMYIDVKNDSDGRSIKDEIAERGIEWDRNWHQQWIGGKPGIRTGEIKNDSGAVKEMVVWQFSGKIFTIEESCFNVNSKEAQEIFEKIVSEFKFI